MTYPPDHTAQPEESAFQPIGYLPPTTPAPAPPPRRRGLAIAVAVLGALCLALVVTVVVLATGRGEEPAAAASPSASPSPSTFRLVGGLSLPPGGSIWNGGSGTCTAKGGYTDIRLGASVTVTDSAGTVVGVGELLAGGVTSTDVCTFSFVIDGIPAGRGFYGIEVAHRGVVRFSEADAQHPVSLTLN